MRAANRPPLCPAPPLPAPHPLLPLPRQVGVGQVIKGWDAGILGAEGLPPMKAGGTRRLIIPPELAYGAPLGPCFGRFSLLNWLFRRRVLAAA